MGGITWSLYDSSTERLSNAFDPLPHNEQPCRESGSKGEVCVLHSGSKMQLGPLISLGHQLGLLLGSHAARQEAASGRARQP